eukprot:COSAG05_NODE_13818_length_417_cov_0.959119_1_plen_109_part_10
MDFLPGSLYAQHEVFCPAGNAMPFFARLPSNIIQRNILSALSVRRCEAGEALYRLDDPSDTFFIVIGGRVRREPATAQPGPTHLVHGSTCGEWENDAVVEPRTHSMIAE